MQEVDVEVEHVELVGALPHLLQHREQAGECGR